MLVCFCGTVFVTLLSVAHSEKCSPVLGQVFSLPTTLSTCDCCHLQLNHVYDNLGLNSFVFLFPRMLFLGRAGNIHVCYRVGQFLILSPVFTVHLVSSYCPPRSSLFSRVPHCLNCGETVLVCVTLFTAGDTTTTTSTTTAASVLLPFAYFAPRVLYV